LPKIAGIKPATVPFILTDPPYGKEWLDQWDELGAFAAKYLRDGGLLVTHAGITYLDKVLATLGRHLTYVWTMNTSWNAVANQQHIDKKTVLNRWIPILVFSKGKPVLTNGFSDTISFEGQEKKYHEWQQPVKVFETLIEYFSKRGDLIVDPCGGSFTTAVAAYRLKRRCIACDIDEQCVRLGAARLNEEKTNAKIPIKRLRPELPDANGGDGVSQLEVAG
jgi:site-specific DNA-methyltransferase (adenine-specific)